MYTPEEQAKIDLLRIMLGDTPASVFYPILMDSEYATLLAVNNWDVNKAARQAAFSILFYLTQVSYRERTGDIEVWNNASIEYRKALNDYLSSGKNVLPEDLIPWVAGANKDDVIRYQRETVRSPLAQLGVCANWWTRVDRYSEIAGTRTESCRGFIWP
jgi:hypothetical protein